MEPGPTSRIANVPQLRLRLMSGVRWSLGLSIVGQLLSFGMNFVLARLVGRSAFGEWAAVQTTVAMISNIAQISMAITATKYVAEFRHTNTDRAAGVLRICSRVTSVTALVASVSLLVASPWVATHTLNARHLQLSVAAGAVGVFFQTVTGYQTGALSGLERFRALGVIGAISAVVQVAAVVALGAVAGVPGAVVGASLASAASWVLHRSALRAACAEAGIGQRRSGSAEARLVFSFALPATLAGIVGAGAAWYSGIVLLDLPQGHSELAVLAAATTFKSVVLFFPAAAGRVVTPLLTNLRGSRDEGSYSHAFRFNLLLTTAAAGAIGLPMALAAQPLLLAFGRSFQDGALVVSLLAVSGVVEVLGIALYQEFFASTWMWAAFWITGARAVVLVVTTLLLVPLHGAAGTAWANLLSQLLFVVLIYGIMRSRRRAFPTTAQG